MSTFAPKQRRPHCAVPPTLLRVAAGAPVRNVLRAPGQALDPAARAALEPRFGRDFSNIRIHHDAAAGATAEALGARAYTFGAHIVFGRGYYDPRSARGQALLAHELTHTIDQAASSPRIERSALDDAADESERGALQIPTGDRLSSVSAGDIKATFTDKGGAKPPVDEVRFGSGIDAKLQKGLQGFGARFFTKMGVVFNVALDLKPVGGVNGVYRFAYVERRTAPKNLLIIELVSTAAPADPSKIDIAAEEKRLARFDFKFGNGFGADDNRRLLLTALARVPGSTLTRIRGVTFEFHKDVNGLNGEAGSYDANTHTIRVFADALKSAANSADAGAASQFTYVVAHEIGHAVDAEHSASAAQRRRDALARQLRDAVAAARKKVDPTKARFGKGGEVLEEPPDPEVTRLKAELSVAERELNTAMQSSNVAPSASTNFRNAQGKPISTLGATSADQNFAELYALYLLDPNLLRTLRPAAHRYFSTTFP